MDRFLLYRTFDELCVGDRQRTRGRTLTEADVVNWCALSGDWFYPHSDAVAAETSAFGRRVVPGIMVFALATGLGVPADATTILANYGTDRLRYTRPTWIGDTVALDIEVEEKTPRDDRSGLVTFRWDVVNQNDELVCTSRLKLVIATERFPYGTSGDPGADTRPAGAATRPVVANPTSSEDPSSVSTGTRVTTSPGRAVRLEREGGLAIAVLERPEKLNALNEAAAAALAAVVAEVARSDARALLLRAEGRAFCAGRDLSDARPGEDPEAILAERFNPTLAQLARLPIPTLAAVQGAALGVGLGLALACDVIVAADNARLGSPFRRLGAVLDSGAHAQLLRRIGPARTLELVYTGRLLDGREAAEWGLVNRSVAASRLAIVAHELAREIAEGPTRAFQASKQLVGQLCDRPLPFEEVLAAEAAAQGEIGRTRDYAEGISAFLAKRSPHFEGR
jgi:2-(1,2-epoxy-1,2-dihydrophenyl)acetyl-CoA isomerase